MDRAQYDASMNLSVESKHQLDISARVSMHSPPKTRPRPVANTATLDFSMGDDLYGYIAPPGTITPHRDVLRWVQSLDLAHSLKDCRRDLANGFYVAQIFSRYFPDKVQMHSFENGRSTRTKRDNWWQIQKFCIRWRGQPLPEELVEDTLQGVHAAGVLLLHLLYETFTGKRVPQRPPDPEPEVGEDPEEPKRRVAAPVTKKGRAPVEAKVEDGVKPVNYGIMGSMPITRTAASSKTGVEFAKAGKIQLGEVVDVQELRRKLQAAG